MKGLLSLPCIKKNGLNLADLDTVRRSKFKYKQLTK